MSAHKPMPFERIAGYFQEIKHLMGDRAIVTLKGPDGDYLGTIGEIGEDFADQQVILYTIKYDMRLITQNAAESGGWHKPIIAHGCLAYRRENQVPECSDPRCAACMIKPMPCLDQACQCGRP